jgi:hypothetical protein
VHGFLVSRFGVYDSTILAYLADLRLVSKLSESCLSPVFGVVFATDTNLIVSLVVVNTTNRRDFRKEAEQCNQPEADDAAKKTGSQSRPRLLQALL